MPPKNYFRHTSAAERYAKYRHYFHPIVIEHLVRFTGCAKFDNVLDVACGTGQSARAVAEVAGRVTAIDNSAPMLALAPQLPNVVYQHAGAEALPFPAETFDLVTVGMAFHWFDQDVFLREVNRVLNPCSWLLVYNNVFMSRMKEHAGFEQWVKEAFLARYMTPHRSRKKLTKDYAREFGFELAGRDNVFNDVPLTREQMVGYFLSQSNVISSVEDGNETIEDVAAWVENGVQPFFTDDTRTLQFSSDIWYLRKKG